MKTKILLLCGILIISFLNEVTSQEKTNPKVSLRNTEVRKIQSSFVDNMKYEIQIALPDNYETSGLNYPVVYYTDAYYWGALIIETYRLVQNEVPPMILVGISWDNDDHNGYYYRSRDFTPTKVAPEDLPNWLRPFTPTSGGADNFLSFIEEELIPMVEQEYRVDKSDRGLLGYSYGGLFSAYVLFSKPALFQKYLIGAPPLFWDDYYVFQMGKDLAASTKALNVKVFSAIGSDDGLDNFNGWIKLRDVLNSSNYEGLSFTYTILDSENHTSAIPAVYSKAFRVLYGKN